MNLKVIAELSRDCRKSNIGLDNLASVACDNILRGMPVHNALATLRSYRNTHSAKMDTLRGNIRTREQYLSYCYSYRQVEYANNLITRILDATN